VRDELHAEDLPSGDACGLVEAAGELDAAALAAAARVDLRLDDEVAPSIRRWKS
jgi:hypothetical protein